jgi:hypothetical protein
VYGFGGDTRCPCGLVPSAEVNDTSAFCGWSYLPLVPCPRSKCAAVAIANEMYLLGGYYATSSGFIGFDSRMIECWDASYNVTSQTWSNLSNSSYSHHFRHGYAAAVIEQDICHESILQWRCGRYVFTTLIPRH